MKENVKSAAQISDAQEAMSIAASESIQNNPTLDEETKATQLNGMAVLEATFTYGEQDKEDIAQRKLPADLTSKLGTARNLPEAFSAVVEHVVGMSDKLGETGLTPEYMRSVIYLNEMEDRVQGLAQVEEISAIMDNMA
ncbi:hypothetical protein, partial [Pseudomonas sp. 21_B]|uniref:hypothetical protein n=1 Tax=Pseudomonas sp. 21_B TaxID=2813561 RepID=UPI001A9D287B